jgi:hypothetical protein
MKPIKINLFDNNGINYKSFIFISNKIPANIIDKLKFNKKLTTADEKLLKEIYGNKWKILVTKKIKGGDQENDEDDILQDNVVSAEDLIEASNIENLIDDQNILEEVPLSSLITNNVEEDIVQDFEDNTTKDFEDNVVKDFDDDIIKNFENDIAHENLISLDEIFDISKSAEKKNENDKVMEVHDTHQTEHKKVRQNTIKKKSPTGKYSVEYITNISFYEFDTILDFKRKVAYATKIPIYKQNISYKINNKIFNMNYNVLFQNTIISETIEESIIKSADEDEINGIPIIINFYNNRNGVKIKQYDTFSILSDVINLGVSEFNMYNLDEFIDIKNNLPKDRTQIEIIYYGFVLLFWPMLTFNAWLDYINSPDFETIYPEFAISDGKSFAEEIKITDKVLEFNSAGSGASQKNKALKEEKKSLESNIFIGINNCDIVVKSFYDSNIINLRNLFDNYKLSNNISACKYSFYYKGHIIVLNKTYKNFDKISQNIPNNILVLNLNIETAISIYILIHPNGDIVVKSKWPEDKLYNFGTIFDIISKQLNPIIEYINKTGSTVINANYHLRNMSLKNSKFSNIHFSLVYRNNISKEVYEHFIKIIKQFENAQLLRITDINDDLNEIHYYFLKGMHKHDETRIEKSIIINNYYTFLTDSSVKARWDSLYNESKTNIVYYKYENIKININNIKEEEFDVFYKYILYIFWEITKNIKVTKSSEKSVTKHILARKNVKALKHKDPVLYDFKRLYNSPIIYSRLCQKSHQPVILTDEELQSLDEKNKARVVKYWNFTTNSPAHYYCPNKKYPYIQFTVNKHPENYCIPCCKIKPSYDPSYEDEMEKSTKVKNSAKDSAKDLAKDSAKDLAKDSAKDLAKDSAKDLAKDSAKDDKKIARSSRDKSKESNKIKANIFNECLHNHKFTEEKTNLIQNTRYILTYGKPISPGRLSNLPETTLEPMLYETFIDITDFEKMPCKTKYYLYGIEQNYKELKDIGFIQILTDIFQKSISELTQDLIHSIKKRPQYFKSILEGNIIKSFKTANEFTNALYEIFVKITSISDEYETMKWNEIFMDLVYYYNDIITVIFDDISTSINENIELVATNRIKDAKKEDFKFIYVIKKKEIYTPIYLVDVTEFFKNKKINKKLFDNTDKITNLVGQAIEFNFNNITVTYINLSILTEFIKSDTAKKYKITKYFINKHNLCYYVEITHDSGTIYIPVKLSDYAHNTDIEIVTDILEILKYKTKFKDLNNFIKVLNRWIAQKSLTSPANKDIRTSKSKPLEQQVVPIYDYVKVEKWIYLENPWNKSLNKTKQYGQIIGFMHNNLNYYHEPISYEVVKKLNDAPLERILYHPDMINKNLTSNKKAVDLRVKTITKDIYSYHLYELLLLEFTILLNKEKNIDLRHEIKKNIIKVDSDIKSTTMKIANIIEKYYKTNEEKFQNINKLQKSSGKLLFENEKIKDINKLLFQINDYITNHNDKKLLLEQIDIYNYEFDKVEINKLKLLSKKELLSKLVKLAKRIVVIVNEAGINKILSNVEEFPNLFSSCQDQDKPIYCKKSKLVITESNLKIMLNIMAADILNPFKKKWIFNIAFVDNFINMFKFIKRPNEYITLEIE